MRVDDVPGLQRREVAEVVRDGALKLFTDKSSRSSCVKWEPIPKGMAPVMLLC